MHQSVMRCIIQIILLALIAHAHVKEPVASHSTDVEDSKGKLADSFSSDTLVDVLLDKLVSRAVKVSSQTEHLENTIFSKPGDLNIPRKGKHKQVIPYIPP